MNQAEQIKGAMSQCGITNVVMIDDAFDPPAFGSDDFGDLYDFLTSTAFEAERSAARLTAEQIEEAVAAIGTSDYSAAAITQVVAAAYHAYVEGDPVRPDPGGLFHRLKGGNVDKIRPLLRLLQSCTGLKIKKVGGNDPTPDYAELKPEIVFFDYFLNSRVSPGAVPEGLEAEAGRAASIEKLKAMADLLPDGGPSIVLMSSHDVEKQTSDYRKEAAGGRIFASRFRFLDKNKLKLVGNDVEVEAPASDALLDTAQCRRFAMAAETALLQWKRGAETAVEELWTRVADLELRDLAYLVRFRLAEEGQPLSAYIEWFFGECLVDAVGRSTDWGHEAFKALDDGRTGMHIEGAFDGQTSNIADLYSRARIDHRPRSGNRDLRLGDLFTREGEPGTICAVVTPDCDLVRRKGGANVSNVLTVSGQIRKLNTPEGSVADFIHQDDGARNIGWRLKDLRTIPYDELVADGGAWRSLGTLRPLYAYELQRRVLGDLGRVGLTVAPALWTHASAEVLLAGPGGISSLKHPAAASAVCAVVVPRGPTDKAKFIFHRSFVHGLLETLKAIDPGRLDQGDRQLLADVLKPEGEIALLEKLCRNGVVDGANVMGIAVGLRRQSGRSPPWCQVIVKHVEDA